MATDSKSVIFTGARARLTIGGKRLGWAFGCSASEEIAQEAAEVLDRFEPYEYTPTSYRVTFSARWFRVVGEELTKHGFFTKSADNPDDLRRAILDQLEMEAQITDPKTGKSIGKLKRVKPASRNIDIGPRGLVGENVQFTAIYFSDAA